ncbi:MAG TPA: TlpA disulfide reductase family protein [Phycisphaerae bacterium]|nr:TlpA disulfide reductase family protein [Phycisphaerae bacterium]
MRAKNYSRTSRSVSVRCIGCVWLGLLALALAAGCTTEGYPYDNTFHVQGKAPSHAPAESSYAYRYPDTAPVLDAAGLQDFVSKFKHRVVLLDFWASWSRQNRAELAMLARMQEDMQSDGFQVIACSLDSPDQWSTEIVPMLHGSKANYPCVVIPQSARAAIRSWLSPDWSYDLPARFVISRTGQVTAQALGGESLGAVEQQVRRLVMGGTGGGTRTVSTNEVGIRLTLVNVAGGIGESLGEATARDGDMIAATREAARLIAAKIDRASNPRIAVLPFSELPARAKAGPSGIAAAQQTMAGLKDQGFYDLIEPARAQRMIDGIGQTAVAIEYDPTAIQGKIAADFLVIGWLRGEEQNVPPRTTLAGGGNDQQHR